MESSFSGAIVSTGSELMLGRMVDTNSAWLSEVLAGAGVRVNCHLAVGDDMDRLVTAFREIWTAHQIIIVTGGLGPTEDDLTRKAVAEAFGLKLEFDEELADEMRGLFARRGYSMTDNNLRQAWLPRGSILVPNPVGTAPGFALAEAKRLMVFLPGVPKEMKHMAQEWLLPRLKEQFPEIRGLIKTVTLKTAGLGESAVDHMIGDLMTPGHNPTVGLLASPDMVRVIVSAKGDDEAECDELLAPVLEDLEQRLDGHVFSRDDSSLAQVTAALLKELDLNLTILDAITQSRLSGSLSPSLDPNNWGGAQDLPWQPAVSGVKEILRLYSPDAAVLFDDPTAPPARRGLRELRLVVTARPDPEAPEPQPGDIALAVESAVQGEAINGGLPLIRKFRIGGANGRTLYRTAGLTVFHLWQVLRELKESLQSEED